LYSDYNAIHVIISKESKKNLASGSYGQKYKNITKPPIIFDLTDIHCKYFVIINIINMDFHKNVVHSNTSQSQNNESGAV